MPILPDSTGRRLILRHHLELTYSGASSTTTFGFGDIIIGQNSGVIAIVGQVIATSTSAGTLIVTLNDDNTVDADFTDGENILLGGSSVAQVNGSTTDLYVQPTQIISYNNPNHGQIVDRQGQAYVRFSEGAASIDAFNKLRVSEPTPLGIYNFKYDDQPNLMSNIELVSGSVLFESGTGASLLQNDTDNGSFANRTSHIFHKYVDGQSQLIEMAIEIGDNGKTNVVRRWGYFDNENGFFFELSGTQKAFIIRSTQNGTTTDSRILQDNWNVDTLDGGNGSENRTDINLDMSKSNIYWIDLTWPIGKTRFGILSGDSRKIVHVAQHANVNNGPITRTASLPVRWEQENIGTAASISELRCYSARVWTEGKFNVRDHGKNFSAGTGPITISNTETPIYAIRPSLTSSNGTANHAVMLLDFLTGYAISGSSDELVKLKLYSTTDAALIGSSYSNTPSGSLFDIDIDATTLGGGQQVAEIFIKGDYTEDASKYTNYVGQSSLKLFADGTQVVTVFTAQTVRSGSVSDMELNIGWLEVID